MNDTELKTEETTTAFREKIIHRVNDIDNVDLLEFIGMPLKRNGGYDMDAHKKAIVDMINGINNLGTLEYLHRFLELFLEKWGNAV